MDRDPASVLDIVLACRRLKSFVAGRSRQDLDRDELLQYATLHATAFIGRGAHPSPSSSGRLTRRSHGRISSGLVTGSFMAM